MLFRVLQALDGLFFNFEISKILIVRGKPFQDINEFSFRTWFSNRQLLLHNSSARLYSDFTRAVLREKGSVCVLTSVCRFVVNIRVIFRDQNI